MLVQGKEKRVVSATHEALVDTNTFDAIQKSFQEKAFNIAKHGQDVYKRQRLFSIHQNQSFLQ